MRLLAALTFAAVLSCTASAAPNSHVKNERVLDVGGIVNDLINPVGGTAQDLIQPLTNQFPLEAPRLTPNGFFNAMSGVYPLTLTCETTSEGLIIYTFLQDGREVQRSESTTYTISTPQESDTGSYTCKAANSDGEVFSSDYLEIHVMSRNPPLQAPTLTPNGKMSDWVHPLSSPLTMTCETTSEGPITYTFLQDGTEVQSSESTTYTINSPQLSDAGTYTCKAANSDEEVTSSKSFTLYMHRDIRTIPLQAPRLTANQIADVETRISSLTLTCETASEGSITYTFLQDGKEVQSSNSTTYTIISPQESDAGTYTCKATNGDLEVTSSDFYTFSIVAPSVPLQAPRLTPNGIWDFWVESEDSSRPLTLTCETTSEGPITYTFFHDGTEVQSSESTTYTINDVQLPDSGSYTCKAANSAGEVTSSDYFILDVRVVFRTHVSLTPSGGSCRVEGEDIPVTLTCAATSDGSFTYTFLRYGREVQSSASTTYTINSPQLSDAGEYQCKVTNYDWQVEFSDVSDLYILRPNDTTARGYRRVPGQDRMYQPLCYQDTLYYVHEDNFSDLNTSLSKCQQGGPGAMMAEFNTRDEMNAINAYLDGLQGFDFVYIGAYYDVTTQQWRLPSTGEVLPVTDWESGEPKMFDGNGTSSNHCVELMYNSDSTRWGMFARGCVIDPPDRNTRFLCEKHLS